MSITLTKITPVQHASAIEWLACAFDGATWVDTLTPNRAWREIQNWYDGGWPQFVEDLGDDNWA